MWLAVGTIVVAVSSGLFAAGGLRAARRVHDTVFANVLRLPVAFFDSTPIGRIQNRFTKDIDTIDNQLWWCVV